MSGSLELQQVICPSCKQVISSFSPFAATVECPYCHNRAFNPLITAKKIPIPERIIPFRTGMADLEKALINHLIHTDYVPRDIFIRLQTGNVQKIYLPMYLFQGRLEASWTCNISKKRTVYRNGQNHTETTTEFRNGNTHANFSFLFPAYEGDEQPAELRPLSMRMVYNPMLSAEYDPALLGLESAEPPYPISPNTDKTHVWNQYGQRAVNQMAIEKTGSQLSGVSYSNLNVSASYDLEHTGQLILVPFWLVRYAYNNTIYYYAMDGLGQSKADMTPFDEAEKKYLKSKSTRTTLISCLTFLLVPLGWYLANFKAALIIFGVWLIVTIILNVMCNKAIKKRLSASRECRARSSVRRITAHDIPTPPPLPTKNAPSL